MYQVFCDDQIIYDVRDDQKILLNPKLTLETNNAGSFEFRMTKKHPAYTSIKNMKSTIRVERDGAALFYGRPIKTQGDYQNRLWVFSEGELAMLNDTIQRPAEYHNMSVRNYLGTLISVHNSQVEAAKRFQLGAVSVTDPNDSLYRYSNYETTLGCINEKLIKRLGGYLRIRHENGVRYLDYLKDPWNTNTQIIDFDQNLLKFVKNTDASGIATAIIPLGTLLEDSQFTAIDERLTIKNINGGLDYVSNQAAVNAFGFVFKTVVWDDVTTPEALKRNGEAYLNEVQFENLHMEASAVDLHDLDVNVEMLNVTDLVRVRSAPHGLDQFFPLSKMVIPLDSPSGFTVTLGNNMKNSLTGASNQANSNILEKLENQPTKSAILESAKQNASDLIHTATTGFVTVRSNEILITDTVDFMKATYVWRWNRNGLGYSSTGYNGTYGLAMTIDGKIVADFITAGTMAAKRIRGGLLESLNNVLRFNLNTGVLRVSLDQTLFMYLYQSGLIMSPTEDVVDRYGGLFRASGTNNIICEAQRHPLRFNGSNVGGLYTNDQGEPRVVVKDIYLQQNGQNKASYTLDAQGNARLFTKDIYLQQDGQDKASFTINSSGQPGIGMGDTGAWWGINANSGYMALVTDEIQAKQNFFFQNKLVKTTNITDTSGTVRQVLYV